MNAGSQPRNALRQRVDPGTGLDARPQRIRLNTRLHRRGLVIAGGCLLLSWILAAAAAEEKKTVSFGYRFTTPVVQTNGQSVRLTIAGCQQLDRLGEPVLPFRTARLIIPSGYNVDAVEALAAREPEAMGEHWQVESGGQPYSRPNPLGGASPDGRNRHIYDSDAPYPASAAQFISVQRLAGRDIALVRVFPLRYHPARGGLLFASQMEVRLTLSPRSSTGETPLRSPNLGQSSARVAAFADNPEALPPIPGPGREAAPALSPTADYLLITSSNLAAAFQPLVERKIEDGLAVKVVSVESITNTVTGRDVPEKIRNFIRQAYTNWGISYVLLGGGTTIVPCRYAFVRADLPAKDSYVPCDLYYGCLDGSWNGNDDRHWGEPNDGENEGDVDLLAEVFVGRAPVSTVQQVGIFVEKTLRYETERTPNASNALLLATYLGDFANGPCQGTDIFNPLRPLMSRWQSKSLDDSPGKLPQWSGQEALSEMNRSPHVVLYSGYGNADVLMRMHTWDLTKLTNQWPFLACSVACSAGQFDHGRFFPDSFGETLVNGNSHGAFAAILNSRAGWFDPQRPWQYSGEFQSKLFEQLLLKNHGNLGMANQLSKEDLIGLVERDSRTTYRWCYFGITLLGDPHVPFRTHGKI